MNKQQIAEKLIERHEQFTETVLNLSEAEFLFSFEEKWTAGQQLEHLLRAVRPLNTAFGLPKIVPRLLFGKARNASREYEQIVETYRGKLASGSKASKRFIPPPVEFAEREKPAEKLLKTARALTSKFERFSEPQFDRILLPHPILGKLTLREILYFTIYHVEHHRMAVLRNLETTREKTLGENKQDLQDLQDKDLAFSKCSNLSIQLDKS